MPSRRWIRRVTRPAQPRKASFEFARQSSGVAKPHVLNAEPIVDLHAFRPSDKVGKNSAGSKAFGYGPHDTVNPDKKNQVKPPPQVTPVANTVPGIVIPPIPPGSPLLGAIENTATSGLIIPTTSTPSFLFPKAPTSFSALPPLPSLIVTGPPSVLAQTGFLAP